MNKETHGDNILMLMAMCKYHAKTGNCFLLVKYYDARVLTSRSSNINSVYYDVQDDEDAEQVCVAIQGKNGQYSTALQGGSKLYDYSNSKNIDNDDKWKWDTGKEGQNDKISGNKGTSGNGLWSKTKNSVHNMASKYGFSAAEMWAIIAAALLFGILAILVTVKFCCMGKKKAKLDLDDTDDAVTRSRREPLVNNPEVYVA